MNEPQYVSIDDDGRIYGGGGKKKKDKKKKDPWWLPRTTFEQRLLDAVGASRFYNKDDHMRIADIEKGMVEMAGKCRYPAAWVEEKIAYVIQARSTGEKDYNLRALITIITNSERLEFWKKQRGQATGKQTVREMRKEVQDGASSAGSAEEEDTDSLL